MRIEAGGSEENRRKFSESEVGVGPWKNTEERSSEGKIDRSNREINELKDFDNFSAGLSGSNFSSNFSFGKISINRREISMARSSAERIELGKYRGKNTNKAETEAKPAIKPNLRNREFGRGEEEKFLTNRREKKLREKKIIEIMKLLGERIENRKIKKNCMKSVRADQLR